jgi:D-xylose transport system permease protein
MPEVETAPTGAAPALADERLQGGEGLRGVLAGTGRRIRDGDLGMLPVVGGLIVIAIVFNSLNSVFLSSRNLSNLLFESVPVGVIALGIVAILLVAEIDLSVGSVSGLSAALVAVLWVNNGLPVALAVFIAIGSGAAIGALYSVLFNRVGVPSFVITLAGLLGFVGVQLWLLGDKGAVNLPYDSTLVKFAQIQFVPEWLSYVFVVAAAGGLFLTGFAHARERRRAGLAATSISMLVVRSVAVGIAAGAFVAYLNQSRGIGWMFVFFLGLVLLMNYMLTRTSFGRAMFAVGGNTEAARRAGINVKRIYLYVFILCSSFAALGGVLSAARLAAANQASGGADVNLNAIAAAVIGGTSLFGGRGSAFAALFGILVIQSISNGLTLLSLSSSYRFMITGVVLLLAVSLDAIARRSRVSHGRA